MNPNEMAEKWIVKREYLISGEQQFLLDLKEVMRGIVGREAVKNPYDQECKWTDGFNSCRSEILRRIEEVK